MGYQNREKQREYQRRWMAERRAAYFADKCCAWCGATDELHLHHVDPSKKTSHNIWGWSEARRLEEIAKCIVLCCDCHQRAHAEARRVESELRYPCGTIQAFWRGCKCRPCMDARRDYERARKAAA